MMFFSITEACIVPSRHYEILPSGMKFPCQPQIDFTIFETSFLSTALESYPLVLEGTKNNGQYLELIWSLWGFLTNSNS